MSEYTPLEHQIWELTKARSDLCRQRVQRRCESPIEVDFLVAFCMVLRLWRDDEVAVLDQDDTLPYAERHYYIRPQVNLGSYRVDFVVGLSTVLQEAIVECDGREFHHSSWEQIERDRTRDASLTDQGYKIFRFPGTELYNKPCNCASNVIVWLESLEIGPR